VSVHESDSPQAYSFSNEWHPAENEMYKRKLVNVADFTLHLRTCMGKQAEPYCNRPLCIRNKSCYRRLAWGWKLLLAAQYAWAVAGYRVGFPLLITVWLAVAPSCQRRLFSAHFVVNG